MSTILLPHGHITGERYIDRETGQELDVAYPNGVPRVLGCLPPRDDFGGHPKLRAALGTIPQSDWKAISLRGWGVPILNQGEHGSCVGHGGTEAFWCLWLMQGFPVPAGGFSPTWLYSLINGGFDGGAVISDAMTALMQTGCGLMNDVPENVIFKRQMSNYDALLAKAAHYKTAAAYHLESFDDICSAIQMGLPVVFAIRAGGEWPVDPDTGIVKYVRGPGNHAQFALGMKQIGGQWCVEVQNSWGTDWGQGGYYYCTEKHIDNAGQDAFAIQFNAQDPSNPVLPPKAA